MTFSRKAAALGATALTAALLLSACSGKTATVQPSADADLPKVAMLYGTTGDFSFMDSAYKGFTDAQSEFSFTPLDFSSPNTDDYQDRLDLAISQGAGLAIGIGFQYATPMEQTTEHPDTQFVAVDIDKGTSIPDVTTISFAAEQSSYLVGVAAALTSKTGHIGFIGGVDQPSIQNFFVGYEAGAKSVNPSITVDTTYLSPLGDFTGFSDPTKGKEAAASMYAGGADVIYAAAGGSGQGVYEQAAASSTDAQKNWAIGVDGDVYNQVDESIKPFILTSAIKNVNVAVEDSIKSFLDGSLEAGEQDFDLSNDGVGYSTSGDFLDAYTDQLEKAKQDIIDGTIEVPSAV
ncbi:MULTISPECIES: BMP family lipoprotein [Herbiconiux]|uniref:Basic membrane protein A n=1 Tax=Herbiconiux flava TaxID=881268 RepID=A0A852SMV5_9MICO|nr:MULTISPECIES: BMP family ABC transporter substrate-binding protein [Herbiconiux]NQX35978.1 BMP family ABC transporter substrate-binding protein [Herbiconiux sp. VKM Ac-2851]NYD70133.1 basic membrane protein A [Herbiconiux flava]GLK16885.1 BMP family ABC transporter substrate-binding protein [Herbiconiux flava]